MTCQQVIEFLMAYLAGELSEEVRSTFESHMIECPECMVYLNTYRAVIRMGKCACTEPCGQAIPNDLADAILRALAQEGTSGPVDTGET